MRLPLVPVIILILVNLFVDTYIYKVLKSRIRSLIPSRVHLIASVVLYALIIIGICMPRRTGDNGLLLGIMWCIYWYFAIYFSKYAFVVVDLLGRIPQLFHRHRIKPIGWLATIIGFGLFATFAWAACINRFRTQVKEVEVEIAGLPAEFDGYRMIQFSDLHTGTFAADTTFVAKLVDEINGLNPDVILFTGDIVNSRSYELKPHTSPLSRLSAPDGVISILGNHDYGDYSNWPSDAEKMQSRQWLADTQKRMGWRLLKNETAFILRGTDSIAIIGVENIGDPPFPIYGSLTQAYPTLSDSVTKILLSHNPAHWVDSISDNPAINVPLTLSGHTHAMQMQIGSFSPAKWRYSTWGGLYTDSLSRHQLYVNIGSGTVGFPARIGATPEITVITLKKKD